METTPSGWMVIDRARGVLTRSYKFSSKGRHGDDVRRAHGRRSADGGEPPTGLDEAAYAELAPFGEVGALVANNGFHYLGQAAWRARFPTARSFAPAQAVARIDKKSKVKLSFEPMAALAESPAPTSACATPETKRGEAWCWARTERGHAWYASDVLANMPKRRRSRSGCCSSGATARRATRCSGWR
jgi:hypothetical protein